MCDSQLSPVSLTRRASFSWRCVLSTMPLDCGWYAVVRWCRIPSLLIRTAHQENCMPQSEVSSAGTLNLAIEPATRASATAVGLWTGEE